MNATDMARTAYGGPAAPVRSARSTEYEIFARVTRRLKDAADAAEPRLGPMAEALHQNRRLWAILAADLAGDDNALPEALRAQLVSLAEFTRQHTQRILRGEAQPDVLVEINTAVMRGLRPEGVPE
ncbi:flagellar biosynthesis regulator FlaF [Rhodovulum sp. YNF3179]|uniref:flagellar biosynthesis regulator FlaF n=1 Tax=Rhodovulum sp. YNF3179 TaxID=3425127 RepID=UPI003D35856B